MSDKIIELKKITLVPFEMKFLTDYVFSLTPQVEIENIDKMEFVWRIFDQVQDDYLVKYNEIVDPYYVEVKDKEGKKHPKIPAEKILEVEKKVSEIELVIELDPNIISFIHDILYAFPKNFKNKDGSFGIRGRDDIVNFVSLRHKF